MFHLNNLSRLAIGIKPSNLKPPPRYVENLVHYQLLAKQVAGGTFLTSIELTIGEAFTSTPVPQPYTYSRSKDVLRHN